VQHGRPEGHGPERLAPALVVARAVVLEQHLAASRNQQSVQTGHTAVALHLRKAREVAIGRHDPMSA
jgi:hypothetical protein